jgi:predicted DCC family thiol-disulfide oxidoreductase YuxK
MRERTQQEDNRSIIFFDGVCNLCNRSVDFLIRRDKRNRLLFAPLQGEMAKRMIPALNADNFSTFIYCEDGRYYSRSSAALRALGRLSPLWSLVKVFLLLPPFLRDAIYNYIAKKQIQLVWKKRNMSDSNTRRTRKILELIGACDKVKMI